MTRLQRGAMLGVAAVLLVILGFEWLPGETPVVQPAAPRHVASGPQEQARIEARDTEAWVGTILARPLFSVGRKPPKAAAVRQAGAEEGMPRLSGIMIWAGMKRAIFAPEGGGKTLVLAEGASLADTTIRTIRASEVILASGEVLHPAYDKNRVPVPTPGFVPPDMARPGFAPPNFGNPAANATFNPAFPGGAFPTVPGAGADPNDTAPPPGPAPFRGMIPPQRRE